MLYKRTTAGLLKTESTRHTYSIWDEYVLLSTSASSLSVDIKAI